ncbi:MAG: GatB/YqeY domain-containing protein [Dehalococcoidia bacterium]
MTLSERITGDLRQAIKERDDNRRSTLRLVLASIQNAEIAKQKKLDDAEVLSVLAREAKQRKESIESFKQGNRPDLATKEEEELAIITGYLPTQLSHDELVEMAKKVITDAGATGIRDKGKVMSQIVPQIKGKAEGKDVSDVVTELLSSM